MRCHGCILLEASLRPKNPSRRALGEGDAPMVHEGPLSG